MNAFLTKQAWKAACL